MELHGRVYRKVNDGRWMRIAEVPELFNEIVVDDTNDQVAVAERMRLWAIEWSQSNRPLRVDEYLDDNLIIVTIDYDDRDERESRLIVWGKSDVPLVRRGGVSIGKILK